MKNNFGKSLILLSCVFISACNFQPPMTQQYDAKTEITYQINELVKQQKVSGNDSVSVISTGKKGASFLTKISFEDGNAFTTKASSNGVAPKTANDIAKVDVYLVELSGPPAAGSDPLATANIKGSSANLPKTGSTFNVLFSGVPANVVAGNKYCVGVVAKDSNGVVISRQPSTPWTGNTALIAPALAITTTGISVNSSLQVDSTSDLVLSVPLLNGIGANISGNVSLNNGSTTISQPIDTTLSQLYPLLKIYGGSVAGMAPSTNNQVATNVLLSLPRSVAADASGNVYIADTNNNYIEKIDTNGNLKIIAGKVSGSSPADSNTTTLLATDVQLSSPGGVAVDTSGNVYIADTNNNYIEKIDTNGNLKIIAGGGGSSPSVSLAQATSVSLNKPNGVTVDTSGNVYIADTNNNYIEKIDTNGNLKIIAGGGGSSPSMSSNQATSVSLNKPNGVTVDTLGNVYIADTNNNYIEKIDTNGNLKIIAGGGVFSPSINNQVSTDVQLFSPSGVAINSFGNIFITDTGNNFIEKIDTNGNLKVVAGNSSGVLPTVSNQNSTSTRLSSPIGIAIGSLGNIYITDSVNKYVEKIANIN